MATRAAHGDAPGSGGGSAAGTASSGSAARTRRCRLPSGERVDEDPRRIDAVVMILEDVLYDHTNMLAHFAIERAIQQLIKERAFPNTVAAYEALQSFRHAFGYRKRFPRFVDSLIAQERLSPVAAQNVIRAYYESQITEARTIRPFDKARDTLQKLRDVYGYRLGLVCVGKDDVQLERLRTLELQDFFSEIVFVPSNPSVAQLSHAMKEVGRRLMLQPSSILFVGRKVFYEIKAANKVGLVTVRMLHGKYSTVMPIEELEQPDFQIGSIDQLVAIVRLADQQMIKPKIVALGGGTGLAVLLKELRHYPADLTAIVTVFDSGRHSGALRKYLGILPPGDIRNCLVALSDSGECIQLMLFGVSCLTSDALDEVMNKLMNYRFKENFMEGCSLGNLLLAALTDIQGGFDKAITSISDILNIHGNVLPATLDSTELCAELEDGSVVVSEVNVRSPTVEQPDGSRVRKAPIKRVFLENENVNAFLPAVRAIENADIIVISPGGFYTSIISTLLVPGIRDAISRSAGATVYISNVATQCGQTDGMTLSDTIDVLNKYLGGNNAIDYVIANNGTPPPEVMESYMSRGETLLFPTDDMLQKLQPIVLQGKTFEDVEDGKAFSMKKEWDKMPMIKHCGKTVAGMLYRIIEQELERMREKMMQGGHFRHQLPASKELRPTTANHPPMQTRKKRSSLQNRRSESLESVSEPPNLAEKEDQSQRTRRTAALGCVLLAVLCVSSLWRSRR